MKSSPLMLLPLALLTLVGSVGAIELASNTQEPVDCVSVHQKALAAVARGELSEGQAMFITASCFAPQGH
jgi:hypothetical protein